MSKYNINPSYETNSYVFVNEEIKLPEIKINGNKVDIITDKEIKTIEL